jgi:hypothetical protein
VADTFSALAQLIGGKLATPLFTAEGPQLYQQAYAQNKTYAKPGPYQTKLAPAAEAAFRAWLAQSHVPFDPNARTVDYDMRGYYQATGGPPHQAGQHFPDTYKTPYDTTFSGESRYAKPNTPLVWVGNKLVNRSTGQVVFNGG